MIASKKEILEDLDNFDNELQGLKNELNKKIKEFSETLDLFGKALLELTDIINNMKTQNEKDMDQMKKDNDLFRKNVNETLKKNFEEMKKDFFWSLEKELKTELKDRIEILKKELKEEIMKDLEGYAEDLINNIIQGYIYEKTSEKEDFISLKNETKSQDHLSEEKEKEDFEDMDQDLDLEDQFKDIPED